MLIPILRRLNDREKKMYETEIIVLAKRKIFKSLSLFNKYTS